MIQFDIKPSLVIADPDQLSHNMYNTRTIKKRVVRWRMTLRHDINKIEGDIRATKTTQNDTKQHK